ncbi:Cobalt-zinc-cadmium resistance protein [Staphylococcus argenteus]|uniref:cation diffusion facilitator family transporter n=1 Tax=Staphylococcus TaxID=1279 RepID=UPI00020F3634|nr:MULTISPECIES: cation diffusion facilitator family transporter [Staphylococcus]EGL88980.1 putative metal tolerance protein 1 [Staphylococcus aureus subsp. aureus 21305]MCS4864322.1 cation diffusion facilitator family transporter [Staphylococcus aureus]MRU67962.1 cation diffusion facilitator family transporter [Staphylococcus aureus]MRV09444.1 cation diffusion facilitator family transporter [Staphylococcus aureus]MRV84028.1 cation diffusion facilitator family transporter [Staphylococcus aureu
MNDQIKYFHHVEHRKFQSNSRLTLWLSLIITLIFTIVEFVGGIYTNSLALLSDSFHMLSDVLALGLSMLAIYFASKKPTKNYTYGFLRLEIIVAFLNGLALIIISLGIMYEGIIRIIKPQSVESGTMMFIAILGLIVNIVLTLILVRSLKKENNVNIQSALWHFMGDLLNSLGVIIAVVLIHFTGWEIIDPIISIVISLVILNGGYKIIKNAWKILMESVPEGYNTDEIIGSMKEINGVIDIHEFHLWNITTNHSSLSAHVVLSDKLVDSPYKTINEVSNLLKTKYGLEHVTLQIENIELNHLEEDYFKQYKDKKIEN